MGMWKASRLPGHPVPYDESGRVRRPMVAGAGWLAAAGIATVIGLFGIRLVGESLTGTPGGVLSQEDVERRLAAGTAAPEDGATGGTATGNAATGEAASGATAPGDTTTGDTATGDTATGGTATGNAPGGSLPPFLDDNSDNSAFPGGPADTTTVPPVATTAPGGTATAPATTAPPVQRTFSTAGGTAIASCPGGLAYLVSWSPTQGYGVERARQGPADEVEVRFEGSEGRSEIKVRCSGGVPVARTKDD